MKILDLNRPAAARVMGLDCSTNSIALAVIGNNKLVRWGELDLTGRTVYDRALDARLKMDALATELMVDFACIESAVMVRNIQVAIKMAYVIGNIISSLRLMGVEVYEAKPLEWQTAIGNPILKKVEKDAIAAATPGKTKTWYQNANREFRKRRTIDFVRTKYGVTLTSDNVSDSVGLADYAYNKLTRR
jgi:Holliday junction resolvasome RuvABC endonuclease subunit